MRLMKKEKKMKQIILTGDRPTGRLHLGHYFGTLKGRVALQDMGIKTEVSPISVQQVLDAADKGELKEAFGCGTAAVISPICGLGYKDRYMPLPKLSAEESFGERLRQRIFDIQYNRTSDPYGWRVEVK